MKNNAYQKRGTRPSKHYAMAAIVTRSMLIRAFSAPHRTRSQVLAIVNRYIGDSITPPIRSRRGVRGEFGKDIQRQWSRHIKHLSPSKHLSESGRWLTPTVQSIHDWNHSATNQPINDVPSDENSGVIFDEFGTYFAMPGVG